MAFCTTDVVSGRMTHRLSETFVILLCALVTAYCSGGAPTPIASVSIALPCIQTIYNRQITYFRSHGSYGSLEEIHAPKVCPEGFYVDMAVQRADFSLRVMRPQHDPRYIESLFVDRSGVIRQGLYSGVPGPNSPALPNTALKRWGIKNWRP